MGSGNMNGFGSNNSNSLDALTQAYSGIQQYAGEWSASAACTRLELGVSVGS